MWKALSRRQFLRYSATIGASFTVTGCAFPHAQAPQGPSPGKNLLRGIRIVDAHAHPDQFYDDSPRISDLSSTLEAITEVGMTASAFSAVGDLSSRRGVNFQDTDYTSTNRQLRSVLHLANRGKVKLILKSSDLPDVAGAGNPPGALLAIEGGDALEGKPGRVDEFHRTGVRMITLMHYGNNELGDAMSAYGAKQPAPPRNGLTSAGRRIVDRMQESGMVVDVAHAQSLTLKRIAEMSSKPLVDSHTSPCPAPDPPGCTRARTWEDMERVAKTGGVVCTWPLAYKTGQSSRQTFSDWALEILEMKKRLGMEHVGLGTDGGGQLPGLIDGYRDERDLERLAAAMQEAGLSREEIRSYMGGNFIRVLRQCIG